MPVIMIEINVEVWCSCGAGLRQYQRQIVKGIGIVVEPCEKCIDKATNEAYAASSEGGKYEA